MPSVQMVDFGADPLAQILGNFGQGLSQQTSKNIASRKEEDALKNIMSKITPDMDPQDVMREIFSAKNLPLEQKISVGETITAAREKAAKINKEKIDEVKKADTKKKLLKAGLPEPLADLYSEATVGGQTELIRYLREQTERGGPDYLSQLMGLEKPQDQEAGTMPGISAQGKAETSGQPPVIGAKQIVQKEAPEIRSVEKRVDNAYKGRTPKEIGDIQNKRVTQNTPILQKNLEQLHAIEGDKRAIGVLKQLNDTEQLNSNWFQTINRNPFTGEIILKAAATSEEQLYEKTIKDFITRAKEFFPGRVTNFDLDAFMQRLPRLANSEDGRRVILRQMEIANEIMEAEKGAVVKEFDDRGIRNVDWSDAEQLGRLRSKSKIDALEKEFLTLDFLTKKEETEEVSLARTKVKKGNILMRKPNGKLAQFPSHNAKRLQDMGYEKL